MTPHDIVDLTREALQVGLLVSAPILVTGLVVGLLVGLLQALTQVQEQTVSFVPKLVAMCVAAVIAMPWMISQLQDYVQNLFRGIPTSL